MFLSKKLILAIIFITGIAFILLLTIQFVWIKKSIEVNREQFSNKMAVVMNHIYKSFESERSNPTPGIEFTSATELFKRNNNTMRTLENIIKCHVDSVLCSDNVFIQYTLAAKAGGPSCYLMGSLADVDTSSKLAKSDYKLCLCRFFPRHTVDMGFTFVGLNKYLVKDSSGLIIPSMVLLLLLISLFAYIIFIINRQKTLAELKNDFINNLTHEFKTPLFSIGLTSRLLLETDVIKQSDKLKNYVGLIGTENNRLGTQVDKILQMAAIESGNVILEKNMTDMHRVIERNISSFTQVVNEKGGSISFLPLAKNHVVMGDEVHLSNVISNLLDNAYKYSGEGPRIVVTTRNQGQYIRIEVKDNGLGIDKHSIKQIFDKFYRVNQGDVHNVKGFGLGLSYVKKITEMHSGKIEVHSRRGEGSVFIIDLPFTI